MFLLIFWPTALALTCYLLKKKKIIKKKLFLIFLIVMTILLLIATSLLPVENWLFTFQSPESVLRYTERRSEMVDVLYGNNSYIVVFTRRNGSGGSFVARRTEDGYKLPERILPTRRVAHRHDQRGIFSVYHVRNTSDYFIDGMASFNESVISIYDSSGAEMKDVMLEVTPMSEGGYVIWFSMFIEKFTDDFYFYINDERIYIAE